MESERTFDVGRYGDAKLSVHVRATDDAGVLGMAIGGDLDAVSADQLRTEVAEALCEQPRCIEVDLRDVTFLDSAGIRVLLQCRADADRTGTSFSLVNPPETVVRVLEITGLTGHLGVTRDSTG